MMKINALYDMSNSYLSKKYNCNYFQLKQINEKTYSIILAVKDNRGYKPKPINPSRRIGKERIEEEFGKGKITEI